MINSEAFAKRLQKVIDFYGESASSFAEKIGVQRSSISHILSGRNKPSLDFIMKVLSSYPEVELYWLLNGKGTFPTRQQKETTPLDNNSQIALKENKDKTIERIVIFYNDGSFSSFKE
jgi:transcriptional regulator with XRE-family HTH domain